MRCVLEVLAVLTLVPNVRPLLAHTVEVMDEAGSPVCTVGQWMLLARKPRPPKAHTLSDCVFVCRNEHHPGHGRRWSLSWRRRHPEGGSPGESPLQGTSCKSLVVEMAVTSTMTLPHPRSSSTVCALPSLSRLHPYGGLVPQLGLSLVNPRPRRNPTHSSKS